MRVGFLLPVFLSVLISVNCKDLSAQSCPYERNEYNIALKDKSSADKSLATLRSKQASFTSDVYTKQKNDLGKKINNLSDSKNRQQKELNVLATKCPNNKKASTSKEKKACKLIRRIQATEKKISKTQSKVNKLEATKDQYVVDLAAAEQRVSTAQTKVGQTLSAYNACTGDNLNTTPTLKTVVARFSPPTGYPSAGEFPGYRIGDHPVIKFLSGSTEIAGLKTYVGRFRFINGNQSSSGDNFARLKISESSLNTENVVAEFDVPGCIKQAIFEYTDSNGMINFSAGGALKQASNLSELSGLQVGNTYVLTEGVTASGTAESGSLKIDSTRNCFKGFSVGGEALSIRNLTITYESN